MLYKMQIALFRIWNLIIKSTSYNNNWYAMSLSNYKHKYNNNGFTILYI